MWRWLLFGSIGALMMSGCGGSSDGLVSASGTVTLDDQACSRAVVTFIPQEGTPGNGGTGQTDASGKFAIMTPQGKKGLMPGKYKVTVSLRLNDDGTAPDPNT